MQAAGQQRMTGAPHTPPAAAAPQLNTNFAPSPHAQSYGSPHRSAHHSPHPSPRAHAHDPFAAATAAAPAQAQSGAHSAGLTPLFGLLCPLRRVILFILGPAGTDMHLSLIHI